jgi:hypothetical protein
MSQPKHNVWLTNKSWQKLALLSYQNLQYSRVINGIGQAYWEMQIQNPVFTQELEDGSYFNFMDNSYYVMIERNGAIVFRGEIDEMPPADTKGGSNDALGAMDRIAFRASHKLDQARNVVVTPDADSSFYIRSFDDVSVGTAVQTLMTEAIGKTNSPLSDVTIGTIENPYNEAGEEIKITLAQQFEAYDTLTVIDALAYVANADYWLDEDNKFHFVRYKGQKQPNVIFRLHFGESGNNLASLKVNINKREMANKVIVYGAGTGTEVKFGEAVDATHQTKYGLKEKLVPRRLLDTDDVVDAYAKSKIDELTSPGNVVVFTPTQSHEPLLGFSIGDIITVDVNWFIYKFIKEFRVEGITTYVNQENSEFFSYNLSIPKKVRTTPA